LLSCWSRSMCPVRALALCALLLLLSCCGVTAWWSATYIDATEMHSFISAKDRRAAKRCVCWSHRYSSLALQLSQVFFASGSLLLLSARDGSPCTLRLRDQEFFPSPKWSTDWHRKSLSLDHGLEFGLHKFFSFLQGNASLVVIRQNFKPSFQKETTYTGYLHKALVWSMDWIA
jgi:hypothetical protein